MQHSYKINVPVDLQPSDIVRANLWFFFDRRSMRAAFVFFFLLGGTAALMHLRTIAEPSALSALYALALLLAPAAAVAAVYVQSRLNYSRLKDFQRRLRHIFSAEGYDVGDGKSFSHVSWDSVLRVVETKNSFNLFFHRSLFHVVPKRCFRNAEDIGEMRSLLTSVVGARAELPGR